MSRQKAHLSWERVLNKDMVLWPFGLLAWETTWSMRLFVRELEGASVASAEPFQSAEQYVVQALGQPERWRASTSEYGMPRPGQVDRRSGIGPLREVAEPPARYWSP
jgi:hypothetical protein